jgi:hypothetical protein
MPIEAQSPPADFKAAKEELADALQSGKQAATDALHDARDEITRKAGDITEEAKTAIADEVEGVQQNLGASLKALGGALRAASEHLANNDQRTASNFALDAAGGIERLSSSLGEKPFADVLDEIRSFGRQNSGALIAGSVLAGLALGRFIKSTAPGARSSAASGQPSTGLSDNGDRAGDAQDSSPANEGAQEMGRSYPPGGGTAQASMSMELNR